jgi:hypothetical protein
VVSEAPRLSALRVEALCAAVPDQAGELK